MKLRAKCKNDQLNVKVKLSGRDVVDSKEADFIFRVYIRGFLKPMFFKRNTIEYTGPVGITLSERLKKPVSKYDFFFIMEQIIVATQRLSGSNLHTNRIALSNKSIFINEVTKELQFVYLPIEVVPDNPDVLSFMESIIYLMKLVEGQDNDYISRFMYFITSLNSYDPNKIERYIDREDNRIVRTIKQHGLSRDNAGVAKPTKEDDEPTDLFPDEKTDLIDDLTDLLDDAESTGIPQDDPTLLLTGDETCLLDLDEESTALLSEDSDTELIHYPYLERTSTGETVMIDKAVFRLGKESSCVDYVVINNNTVSGSHADIITRKQKYFVIDLNSKNRTYINNRVLPTQYEVEIFDGDRLKLSNEEFVFHI